MKRIRKTVMLVLMAAMLCLCAAAAAQAQGLTGENVVIQPEPIGLSMDTLAGKTVLVRVGAYHQEDHTLELTVL